MSVSLKSVPNCPAIYALYGVTVGKGPVAYVGEAGKLRERLQQHLVRRDSSVTTGAAIVSLNPDLVRGVAWWTDDRFSDAETQQGAELVAFDVLQPILRSQGRPKASALSLYAEKQFQEEFQQVFSGSPSGTLPIETLAGLSARLENLEARLDKVEREMKQQQGRSEDKAP